MLNYSVPQFHQVQVRRAQQYIYIFFYIRSKETENFLQVDTEWREYQFNFKCFLQLSLTGKGLFIMYLASCCLILAFGFEYHE